MTFDKYNLKTIRNDIDAALATVEAKHGVKFNLGNIRFNSNDFRAKLECVSATNASGNTVNPDQVKFEANAFMFGIKKDAFGKTFKIGKSNYKITGLNPRRHKYPVSAIRVASGRSYKFAVRQLPTRLRS